MNKQHMELVTAINTEFSPETAMQYYRFMEREYKNMQEKIDHYEMKYENTGAIFNRQHMQGKIDRYEESLRFYSNDNNYKTDVINQWEPVIPIMKDEGKNARNALKGDTHE